MRVFDLPDKRRPIPSVQALNRWLSDAERDTGVTPKRLGRLVASTVVVAALQRSLGDDRQALFLVKGGVYIEFNLGLRARTTSDVDTLFRGTLAEFTDRLDESLTLPWGPFELSRTEVEIIDAPKLVKPRRFWVQLSAKGAVWRRIQVEVSFPEGHMASLSHLVPPPNIGFFGLDAPDHLIGVAMDYQVAQKLHAASDPDTDGYENQRVHDICDLLLLKDAFYPGLPPASLRAACVDIFEYRAGEAAQLGLPVRRWPPMFMINDFWRMAYPPLAESLGITLTVDEAVAAVAEWVAQVDVANGEQSQRGRNLTVS
ncbi:MAG: nucleotidyl transferase AbiEii/AbiGii toxin family protein [Propionibacteriaceae bacterium]|nr:nucleotidyl transferase AbiEii/AbiGii toxin family protein [Propionibacteriaceae bacterium]